MEIMDSQDIRMKSMNNNNAECVDYGNSKAYTINQSNCSNANGWIDQIISPIDSENRVSKARIIYNTYITFDNSFVSIHGACFVVLTFSTFSFQNSCILSYFSRVPNNIL